MISTNTNDSERLSELANSCIRSEREGGIASVGFDRAFRNTRRRYCTSSVSTAFAHCPSSRTVSPANNQHRYLCMPLDKHFESNHDRLWSARYKSDERTRFCGYAVPKPFEISHRGEPIPKSCA